MQKQQTDQMSLIPETEELNPLILVSDPRDPGPGASNQPGYQIQRRPPGMINQAETSGTRLVVLPPVGAPPPRRESPCLCWKTPYCYVTFLVSDLSFLCDVTGHNDIISSIDSPSPLNSLL